MSNTMFASHSLLCHLNDIVNEIDLMVAVQMALTKVEYEDSTTNP